MGRRRQPGRIPAKHDVVDDNAPRFGAFLKHDPDLWGHRTASASRDIDVRQSGTDSGRHARARSDGRLSVMAGSRPWSGSSSWSRRGRASSPRRGSAALKTGGLRRRAPASGVRGRWRARGRRRTRSRRRASCPSPRRRCPVPVRPPRRLAPLHPCRRVKQAWRSKIREAGSENYSTEYSALSTTARRSEPLTILCGRGRDQVP